MADSSTVGRIGSLQATNDAPPFDLDVLPRVSRSLPLTRLRPDFVAVANDTLVVWDFALILLSAWLCAAAYSAFSFRDISTDFLFGDCGRLMLVGTLLGPFLLYDRKIVRPTGTASEITVIGIVSINTAVLFGLLLAVGYLTQVTVSVPRPWLTMWFLSIYFGVLAARLQLVWRVRALEERGVLCETVAIVGTGPLADRLLARLHNARHRRFEVAGMFTNCHSTDHAAVHGTLDDLIERGKTQPIDWIILALPGLSSEQVCSITLRLKALDAAIAVCPDPVVMELPTLSVAWLDDIPLFALATRPLRSWNAVLKSVEDKVLGAILLIAALPLMLLVAAAIAIGSPGPILFRQRRHGLNNSEFDTLKFRTMSWLPSGSGGSTPQTIRNDPRVTPVGRLLRKTSIDELPQLINVLRGEMSLVGPRPHPVAMRTEDRLGAEITAEYVHRHRVKPGITGWAQVNGHRGATATAAQVCKRIAFDIDYIDNWSLFLDLKILALTPFRIVFNNQNAF